MSDQSIRLFLAMGVRALETYSIGKMSGGFGVIRKWKCLFCLFCYWERGEEIVLVMCPALVVNYRP